jgi:hypothetical protein
VGLGVLLANASHWEAPWVIRQFMLHSILASQRGALLLEANSRVLTRPRQHINACKTVALVVRQEADQQWSSRTLASLCYS